MNKVDFIALDIINSEDGRSLVLLRHNNGSASFTCCFDVLRDSLKAKGKEKEFSVVLLEPKVLFQHFPFFLSSLLFLVFLRACLVLTTRYFYGVQITLSARYPWFGVFSTTKTSRWS